MKNEKREKLCKIRSVKKAKILISRTKMAAKEILCECEETMDSMNKVICAGAYAVADRVKWKTEERVEKEMNWEEKCHYLMN